MATLKELIQFSPEDREKILKEYNRDPETIKVDVATLKKWLKEQPHLPDIDLADQRLETMLYLNKMSIEKTKKKLDMYFTVRRLLPEFYDNSSPSNAEIKAQGKAVYFLPLRKLTKDCYRPILYRFNQGSEDVYDPYKHFAYILNIMELRWDIDCPCKPLFIVDTQFATVTHVTKISPVFLKKMMYIIEKAYSERTTGLHFINSHSYVEKFLTMVKSVLPPKLAGRVILHKNFESLTEHIPKEILPKEYGGEDRSCDEIYEMWEKAFDDKKSWFEKLGKAQVDEEKRQGEPINDDILGYYGNFRQLSLD